MKMTPSPEADIRFFFDFLSPYSYLAVERIARDHANLAPRLAWRPVVASRFFRRIEARAPGDVDSRRQHALRDLERISQQDGLRFKAPPRHPFNSLYALRTLLAVPESEQWAVGHRLFCACWAEGQPIETPEQIQAALGPLGRGVDPELAGTDPAHRRTLDAHTNELVALGAWGVPSFAVGSELFFGQDRVQALAWWIEARTPPPG